MENPCNSIGEFWSLSRHSWGQHQCGCDSDVEVVEWGSLWLHAASSLVQYM